MPFVTCAVIDVYHLRVQNGCISLDSGGADWLHLATCIIQKLASQINLAFSVTTQVNRPQLAGTDNSHHQRTCFSTLLLLYLCRVSRRLLCCFVPYTYAAHPHTLPT